MKEDIVQIYYARAYSWRGYFGVHPWVAWKKKEDKEYSVAQVTAWNHKRTGTTISVQQDIPDRKWFDNTPEILIEIKGEKARSVIKKIKKEIENYPFKDGYVIWPGPNSNTFISYLIRKIDEFNIELPAHAVGKDYFGSSSFLVGTPSKTGFQFSFFGVLGLTMGLGEGIEFNILGLSFGVDFWNPALKLPVFGRVGFKDKTL